MISHMKSKNHQKQAKPNISMTVYRHGVETLKTISHSLETKYRFIGPDSNIKALCRLKKLIRSPDPKLNKIVSKGEQNPV